MEFYKFKVAILKILLLSHFIAGKLPKNGDRIGFLAPVALRQLDILPMIHNLNFNDFVLFHKIFHQPTEFSYA